MPAYFFSRKADSLLIKIPRTMDQPSKLVSSMDRGPDNAMHAGDFEQFSESDAGEMAETIAEIERMLP